LTIKEKAQFKDFLYVKGKKKTEECPCPPLSAIAISEGGCPLN